MQTSLRIRHLFTPVNSIRSRQSTATGHTGTCVPRWSLEPPGELYISGTCRSRLPVPHPV